MDINDIVKAVRTNSESKQASICKAEVDKQCKLHFFRLFKTNFNVEPSVTINLQTTNVDERKCIFCDNQVIESEIHFSFDCNLYLTLRVNFYADMEVTFNNFHALTNEEKLKLAFSRSTF